MAFPSARRLSAPPPRRTARAIARTPAPRRIRRPPPIRPDVSERDRFNAPFYTLKAFAIATAVVMSSATAAVAGVMAYLDVRNTAEFAAHMRTWVSQSMPLLTAKIYRRPTSHDSAKGDLVASTHESSTLTAFDHDAAQQRLGDAFDKGGLEVWAERALREMEAEIEVERFRRAK